MVIQAHDLLQLRDLNNLKWDNPPRWAADFLQQTPFVVVRRANAPMQDYVPVGIRGWRRSQRLAAWLHKPGIERVITPGWLAEHKVWHQLSTDRLQMPVIAALDRVAQVMSEWNWGPTGSAGFELATGYPTLHPTSDLDLVVYAPQPVDFVEAQKLLASLDGAGIHVDIQVETVSGAFLLREWVQQRTKTVVLRTDSGPVLVKNPWDLPASAL